MILSVALYQHHSPSAFLSGLDLSQRTQILLTRDVGACRHLTNPRGEVQDFVQDWILAVLNQVSMHFLIRPLNQCPKQDRNTLLLYAPGIITSLIV